MVDRDGQGGGEDKQGFLKRWSRLKREEAERKPAEALIADVPPAEETPAEVTGELTETGAPAETGITTEPDEPFDPADLPDIDSLDKDSDFTGFLKDGVPTQLRHMALQKLFRSDPTLAVLDGLNDYDEDFTLAKVAEKIVSSYKPGRGYVDDKDDVEDETGDIEEADIEIADIEDADRETGEAENTERDDADEEEKTEQG